MTMDNCNFRQLLRTDSECYKRQAFFTNSTPHGIIIHGTAVNNANLGRWVKTDDDDIIAVNPNNNWFGSKNNIVTPHATIGITDGKRDGGYLMLVQILPYTLKCWGCGQGKYGSYNDTHIQIEMCQDVTRGKGYLLDVLKATAEWCADLMHIYPTITLTSILSHKEAGKRGYASNHGDPENWLELYDFTMDDFRAMVDEQYQAKYGTKDYYRVQMGAFARRENAEAYAKLLRDKYGFECFVTGGGQ